MFFDSHCHLTDSKFDADRDEVLQRAREEGVTRMVCVASDPEDAERALHIVRAQEGMWCTAGLHPHMASHGGPETMSRVRVLLEEEASVVAVGECGLDYHYQHAPRAVQLSAFEEHLDLAATLDLPVVVHSRDADDDMRSILAGGARGAAGVLHCFTGGLDLLEAAVEAGWFVSFSGIVSFRGYEGGNAVRAVPMERLLIETDAPYLAPVPRRGRRNEPAFVRHVVEAVAALRAEPVEQVARVTTANALAFYNVKA